MSNYPAFDCFVDNNDGTTTLLINKVVTVYDVTNDVALADLASDLNGHVAAGSLAVDVGTEIRFSISLADGTCGYAEVVTT